MLRNFADKLRQRLVTVWRDLEQHTIDFAIDQWRCRLTLCQCKRQLLWTQLMN